MPAILHMVLQTRMLWQVLGGLLGYLMCKATLTNGSNTIPVGGTVSIPSIMGALHMGYPIRRGSYVRLRHGVGRR